MVCLIDSIVINNSQKYGPSSIQKLFCPDAALWQKYGSPLTWNESSPKPRPSRLTSSSQLVRFTRTLEPRL
jgi:hypothetical protein